MNNSLGELFRVSSFGESHGGAVGVVIDGCPAGHAIDLTLVQDWLSRRRPGQSHLSTPRNEQDEVHCGSGLERGISLGTPIALWVHNKDHKPGHYKDVAKVFRPSHADYTTIAKYGIGASSGGGRASARETVARVAAGAVAYQILQKLIPGFEVIAYVASVKDVTCPPLSDDQLSRAAVEAHLTRCPDPSTHKAMEEVIVAAKKAGDSVGGTIRCVVKGCPAGVGGPVFDKLEAELAHGMMSLPATKGFELGSGFAGTTLYGSEHNDAFVISEGEHSKIRTATNRSGGIQGGISNGEDIDFRVAFKPVATIFKPQQTVDSAGKDVTFQPKQGRHDPCVLPRAVPIVEAMACIVIMDHVLRQTAVQGTLGEYAQTPD